jgi:hypothetical protein
MLAALRICFLCCYDTKLLGGSFIYTCCSAWGGWPTGLMFCIPQTYRACCLIRTWNSVLDLILFVPIYLHLSIYGAQSKWLVGWVWLGQVGWAAGLGWVGRISQDLFCFVSLLVRALRCIVYVRVTVRNRAYHDGNGCICIYGCDCLGARRRHRDEKMREEDTMNRMNAPRMRGSTQFCFHLHTHTQLFLIF